jgi:hypothetical protein
LQVFCCTGYAEIQIVDTDVTCPITAGDPAKAETDAFPFVTIEVEFLPDPSVTLVAVNLQYNVSKSKPYIVEYLLKQT